MPTVPWRWSYAETRSYLMRAGDIISAEQAERRVLIMAGGVYFGTPRGKDVSMGIHESQSRMWEIFVGRSLPFWKNMYGRAGHIPGSRNVFYDTLLDQATGRWLPAAQLKPLFDDVGAFGKPKVICYCGGGISATMDALALTLCGHPDIAVYDGSMMEWVADEALPLKLGMEA